MTAPLVSVLLPVYNGSAYLREAVDSILGQSYGNFELIVINDGSTDATHEIMASYSDPRISYHVQENAGLSATLNRAISLARGAYLARQDSDDISRPGRLARQVEFLEANPRCALVGTWAEIWREGERTRRAHRHPAGNAVLQYLLLFNNPFVHSSVMFRRESVEAVGGYLSDRSRKLPEDYELWSRISTRFEVANLPELLHVYRETGGSICRENWDKLMEEVVAISADNIARRTGLSRDDRAVADLAALSNAVLGKVSPQPDLARIRLILLQLQHVPGAAPGDPVLQRLCDRTWRAVRANYYRHALSGRLGRLYRRMGISR